MMRFTLPPTPARVWHVVALGLCCLLLVACRNELHEQPKFTRPFEESPSFGRAARELVPHTVARGEQRDDERFYGGSAGGEPVEAFPIELTTQVLERGQEQYNVFCAPCHGILGDGDGLVVQRGFPPPPSFHTDELRSAPVGHLFQVITEGQGEMFSYADRVPPADRWAIIGYIRALQLSQHATVDDVPAADRGQLERGE